ncbi:S-methyl-5'-thioadenosine phosphorylase [Bacillus velezensis]|uniref:HTH marR-type domain-containing protein n=1 Tax=Bacillus velezensis TaxID=492670 RepID=A0A7W4QI20_BACVE|nr:S-methyl-5'-thioadenosine phosphorylase [Bacillus velezensis]OBR25436.1 S-methyl-5'-thioadenosine phosphorylase [Bacillus velezensis]OCB97736.1 S-methyl-5'-thioadenosine phosphorylase [Bacillus velezensis]QOY27943.1 hypothetical protein BACVE_002981 [Bacillus velezensis]
MTSKSVEHVADIEKSLRHIAAIIKQKGREILNQYAITPPQFVGLQWLYELGDMTIGELSAKMYLACSTTTDLIDRMEKISLSSGSKTRLTDGSSEFIFSLKESALSKK